MESSEENSREEKRRGEERRGEERRGEKRREEKRREEKRRCPTDVPIGQSDGGNSSVDGPSSPVTGIYVKVTNTDQLTGEGAGFRL